MKKLSPKIEKNEIDDLAYRLFMEMSGIDKEGKKFDRMKKDALYIRELIEDRIDINIACYYYDDIVIDNKNARIGEEIFTCSAFEQLNEYAINSAYVYALNVGEYDFKDQTITNRLYADIWGTSFTDAARLLLKKEIDKLSRLSDEFGPGFYGMELSEMTKFDALLNFSNIKLELRNNKILVPVKSCAGIYFSVDADYKKLNSACASCIGSARSCKLCNQRENN